MKKTGISIGLFVGFVILALLLIPYAISTEPVKNKIKLLVQENTGYQLNIEGAVDVSLITGLQLNAEKITLSSESGNKLFSVDLAHFELGTIALLQGKVDIAGITLVNPVFRLQSSSEEQFEVSKIDPGSARANNNSGIISQPEFGQNKSTGSLPNDLQLQSLKIIGGQLEAADGGILTDNINLETSISSLQDPVSITGSLRYRNRFINLSAQLGSLAAILDKSGSDITATIENDLLNLSISGTLVDAGLIFSGNLNATISNIPDFASWVSNSPMSTIIGPLSISGDIEVEQNEIRIPALSIVGSGIDVSSAARISLDQPVPVVRLALDIEELDLDRFSQLGQHSEIEDSTPGNTAQSSGATSVQKTGSAGDTKRDTVLDLSPLKIIDGFVDLRIKRLKTRGQLLKDVAVVTGLADGQLSIELKKAGIASGNLSGTATLMTFGGSPLLTGALNATNLDVKRILALIGQKFDLSGKLEGAIEFESAGETRSQLEKNISARGVLKLINGRAVFPGLGKALNTNDASVVKDVNLSISISDLSAPVVLDGTVVWQKQKIDIKLETNGQSIIRQEPFAISAKLNSTPLNITYTGQIDPAQNRIRGQLNLSGKSTGEILTWLNQPVGPSMPNGKIRLDTAFSVDRHAFDFDAPLIQFGESNGRGNGRIAFRDRPDLRADLQFKNLDLTPFLGEGTQTAKSATRANKQVLQNTGKSSNAVGWDRQRIDMSGLNAFDMAITVQADALGINAIKVGRSVLRVNLANGKLEANLDEFKLYGGSGSGFIHLDATAAVPVIKSRFDLAGLDIRPFLIDVSAIKAVAGKGNIALDLTTQGHSEFDFMNALNGQAAFLFQDGALYGVNVPRMLRSLGTNILTGWQSATEEKTDFSEFSGSLLIKNGNGVNKDLLILGPLVRIAGKGSVNFPDKRLSFRINPKIVRSLKGQGGVADLQGFPVPIIIRGSWNSPKIYPDIKGILTNPSAAFKQLEGLGGFGRTTAKAGRKIQKRAEKFLQKQSGKIGIDLSKILPGTGNSDQQKQVNEVINGLGKFLLGGSNN